MRGRIAILLTATIDPGAYAHQSRRNSIEDRLKDYVSAIRFYLSTSKEIICGVVFCENSNFDRNLILKHLDRQSHQPEFEIISFVGNEIRDNVHYGFSELGIMDYAFCRSAVLRKCDAFVKISGRLILGNLAELIARIPSPCDFAADFRKAYWREGGAPYRARTQVMVFSMKFYESYLFRRRKQMVGLCTHIEEYIPIVVAPLLRRDQNNRILLRFPIECEITGISGSNNRLYNSPIPRLKRTIRGFFRKYLPRIWL